MGSYTSWTGDGFRLLVLIALKETTVDVSKELRNTALAHGSDSHAKIIIVNVLRREQKSGKKKKKTRGELLIEDTDIYQPRNFAILVESNPFVRKW